MGLGAGSNWQSPSFHGLLLCQVTAGGRPWHLVFQMPKGLIASRDLWDPRAMLFLGEVCWGGGVVCPEQERVLQGPGLGWDSAWPMHSHQAWGLEERWEG